MVLFFTEYMEMPLSEVLDRLSIVELKIERIGEPHLTLEKEVLENAVQEFADSGTQIDSSWVKDLKDINGQIWDLESDIRKGKEGELGLEEVGRRAIMIRGKNKIRVGIKNAITEATGIGFRDVKMNHASS
jgi:hypothetical protein